MTSKSTAYLHPKRVPVIDAFFCGEIHQLESSTLIRLDSFNEFKIVNHKTLKKAFALALHTGQVSGGSFSQV